MPNCPITEPGDNRKERPSHWRQTVLDLWRDEAVSLSTNQTKLGKGLKFAA